MEKISLRYRYLLPDLTPWLTLSGSNYLCLQQIVFHGSKDVRAIEVLLFMNQSYVKWFSY